MINVGIREQLLVSTGAGLALAGLRPIVHTFPSFLVERGFEQIKLDFFHQDVGGVLVSYGASYDMPTAGRTHQSPGDVALIDSLPGWTVHVPGHPAEARRLLLESIPGMGACTCGFRLRRTLRRTWGWGSRGCGRVLVGLSWLWGRCLIGCCGRRLGWM